MFSENVWGNFFGFYNFIQQICHVSLCHLRHAWSTWILTQTSLMFHFRLNDRWLCEDGLESLLYFGPSTTLCFHTLFWYISLDNLRFYAVVRLTKTNLASQIWVVFLFNAAWVALISKTWMVDFTSEHLMLTLNMLRDRWHIWISIMFLYVHLSCCLLLNLTLLLLLFAPLLAKSNCNLSDVLHLPLSPWKTV